jgi:hypothetical protein
MTVHVIMPPALEGCAWIVRVVTVHLDHFVQNAASFPQVLVSQVVPQHKENLAMPSACSTRTAALMLRTFTHESDAVTILVVARDMGAVPYEDIAAFCGIIAC